MTVSDAQPRPTVSVVLPVFNAARYLPDLLRALAAQKPDPPREILLVDSQSTDGTAAVAARCDTVRRIPVERFSHGRARNIGARAASGDLVVFMSQDALPADDRWLAELSAPFADPRVAGAYSRQVPRPDASPMERYFLETRFPAGAPVRREKRGNEALTLERVFFSNVSSAVRRSLLLQIPFDEELIMSEDQQLSRDLLEHGYAVVYQPGSVVIHSHNYSLATVFRRYFDSVYSLTVIFPKHSLDTSASMGFRYLFAEIGYMVRRHPLHLPYYALYAMAKAAGTCAAHFATRMPRRMARAMSLHRYYWD